MKGVEPFTIIVRSYIVHRVVLMFVSLVILLVIHGGVLVLKLVERCLCLG